MKVVSEAQVRRGAGRAHGRARTPPTSSPRPAWPCASRATTEEIDAHHPPAPDAARGPHAGGGGGLRPRHRRVAWPAEAPRRPSSPRTQLLELYRFMRLNRMVEEKLTNLYRQGKVVGGLYRSLGQEACSVGSAYALERGDIFTPADPQPGRDLRAGRPAARRPRPVHGQGHRAHRRPRPQHPLRLALRGGRMPSVISMLGDMVPILVGRRPGRAHAGQDARWPSTGSATAAPPPAPSTRA